MQLAKIAQTFEGAGHGPETVAGFLTRCLFSMFAEDVGLLPKRAFVELLESLKGNPAQFVPLVGAHYTPRAYVERLVLPTVVEPLREDWKNAQGAALVLAGEGKLGEARAEIHAFHHKLCEVRVLDPACGSGNFLYVTLEHLKRLEGEVLNQLEALGEATQRLDITGITVDPHQLLGLELNPRAAQRRIVVGALQRQGPVEKAPASTGRDARLARPRAPR